MSVLIQGMTLEELWDYGEYCRALIGTGQAIEIPPHGRLVDADELLTSKSVGTQIAGWGKMYHETCIEYAPTVIPADKED